MKSSLQLQPSTAIARASYDPETRQLDIVFASGRDYTFENVPQDVADAFEAAPSPGQFFTTQIKGAY